MQNDNNAAELGALTMRIDRRVGISKLHCLEVQSSACVTKFQILCTLCGCGELTYTESFFYT